MSFYISFTGAIVDLKIRIQSDSPRLPCLLFHSRKRPNLRDNNPSTPTSRISLTDTLSKFRGGFHDANA